MPTTEQLQEQVAHEICRAENRGGLLKSDFEELMNVTGHQNFADLIRRGIACLDVEYGQEIFAFSPYHPKVFFATESVQYGSREEMISLVLGELVKKYSQIRLIREPRGAALSQIKSSRGGLGLITWLNIFDDGFVGTESLKDMVNQVTSCLGKDGLFVFSFNENESSRSEVFTTLAGMDFSGLRLQYAMQTSTAGSIFLIGQKTG